MSLGMTQLRIHNNLWYSIWKKNIHLQEIYNQYDLGNACNENIIEIRFNYTHCVDYFFVKNDKKNIILEECYHCNDFLLIIIIIIIFYVLWGCKYCRLNTIYYNNLIWILIIIKALNSNFLNYKSL